MAWFDAQAGWLRWRGLPLLVLLASLAVTAAYGLHERAEQQQQQRRAFDNALRDLSLRIDQRMAAHQHLLQGVQGFLAAYPRQDEVALRRYVDALPLGADFAGLQGVALARLQGLQARVDQIEPAMGATRSALGRDLMEEPAARLALAQAGDSGRMALSAKLDLRRLGLGAQPGFLLATPIYRDGDTPGSVERRRAALSGWALLPVAAPELIASLCGELPEGLRLALYDGQGLADADLLYRSSGSGRAAAPPRREAREFLVIGGHTWTLALAADAGFAAEPGPSNSSLVFISGGVLSVLAALLAGLLGTARERAQGLAERMTQALRESERRWAFALEGAGDGVWDWQPQSGAVSTSLRLRTMLGLRGDQTEVDMAQLSARIHPEDQARAQAELQLCLDGKSANLISEYRVTTEQGAWCWVLARGTVVERDESGRALRMIGTLSDINARRHSEERVRFMALHDPLTELANRAHFEERLHFALANARRYQHSIGLILLDLDRFKPINDQHGHAIGDQLLQTVARRIRGSVRETDTVGRIGGDEFVVLLTGPINRETAQLVADKIFNQVALPMELSGLRLEITCSLGLALYPEDASDELALNKAADDAMYRNKRAGYRLIGEARAGAADGGS